MRSIGEVIGDSSKLQAMVAEEKKRILSHEDIQWFITLNEGLITDEMIDESLTRLNEYIVRLNDSHYKPKLIIYNGFIEVVYIPRDEALVLKQERGIGPAAVYDEITTVFKGNDLTNFEANQLNINAFSFTKDFNQSYRFDAGFTGMWLCGQKGVGKTYLMACLAGSLAKRSVGVTFVSVASMINKVMNSLTQYNEDKYKILSKYKKAEVLVLDDMGTEYLTAWIFDQILFDILNYRMNHKLATFFTSNLTVHDYTDYVSRAKGMTLDDAKRLKTRIDSLASEVQMSGIDRRPKA